MESFAGVLETAAVQRHVERQVRVWLGVPSPDVVIPRLPAELARLLLRIEEYEHQERDAWGGWPSTASESFVRGFLREPEIDAWLERTAAALPRDVRIEPRWPNGRRFAVCLTHDVDMVSAQSTPMQAFRYARSGLARGSGGRDAMARLVRPGVRLVRTARVGIARSPSVADTLECSLQLELTRGATASYLFTVPPHRRRSRYDCSYAPDDHCLFRGRRTTIADVMRAMSAEGFDIGLHGSYAAASTPGMLGDERLLLETATGLEITTTRQHFLSWDIRWTPAHQKAAGLMVDSTLGFNFDIGFRAGTSLPFRLFDLAGGRPLDLLEVPLVAQDGAMLGETALALSALDAQSALRPLFDSVAAVGGVMTLLVHPDKLARPDWLALYEWSLDYALEKNAWLTSLRDLAQWWREREARVLGD